MAEKTVYVELVAETRRLRDGLKDVDRKVSKTTQTFKRLGLAIAGAFSARAVFRSLSQTLRATEDLIRTSRGVGFATDEWRQLTFAMESVGVGAETARIALGDLQKRLSNKSFEKFFIEAELDPDTLLALPRAKQLEVVLQRMLQMRDNPRLPGILGGIFEEQSAKEILKVLLQWEEFEQARRDWSKSVGGLGEADENSILKLTYQTKLLTEQWEALKMKIVADAAPAIQSALDSLSDDQLKAISETIGAIVSSIATAVSWLSKIPGAVKKGQEDAAVRNFERDVMSEETPDETAKRLRDAFVAKRAPLRGVPPMLAAPGGAQGGVTIYQTNNINASDPNIARAAEKGVRRANDQAARVPRQ